MKVEFHSDDKNTLLGEVNTWEQVVKCMNDYLKEIIFKSYYMRFWIENNVLVIDYGSHLNFFHISDMRIKDFPRNWNIKIASQNIKIQNLQFYIGLIKVTEKVQ